jgi:DNA-binding NtrC family response regulator
LGRVILVDDDPSLCALVERFLQPSRLKVRSVHTARDALLELQTEPDAIVLDLGLPDRDGLDLLSELRRRAPDTPIVILTADNSVNSVVSAMQMGAYDYLSKPIDRTKLTTTLGNAIDKRQMSRRLARLESTEQRWGLVGSSPSMRTLFSQMDRVANADVTVAVHGESGSGKELVARALHGASDRSAGPFVALNCAAIPETLQESELFGHEKGAFTGATQRRIGRFEQANGGTLFLDEVAELSPALQAKLLRSLQERTFTRVGGTTEVRADFRLITATHKDLAEEVASGRFREDLYYRVAVFELRLPPLRERADDIPVLARHFLKLLEPDGSLRFSAEVMQRFSAYSWPGNVRELQNAVQHAAVIADEVIGLRDLPPRILSDRSRAPTSAALEQIAEPMTFPAPTSLPAVPLAELERMAIEQSIERNGGNVSAAIRELGIGRTTLYRKLKEYGLR